LVGFDSVVVQVPLVLPSALVQVVATVPPHPVTAICVFDVFAKTVDETVFATDATALHLLLEVHDLEPRVTSAVVMGDVTGLSAKQEPFAA
jgi:hypothetical protein